MFIATRVNRKSKGSSNCLLDYMLDFICESSLVLSIFIACFMAPEFASFDSKHARVWEGEFELTTATRFTYFN